MIKTTKYTLVINAQWNFVRPEYLQFTNFPMMSKKKVRQFYVRFVNSIHATKIRSSNITKKIIPGKNLPFSNVITVTFQARLTKLFENIL